MYDVKVGSKVVWYSDSEYAECGTIVFILRGLASVEVGDKTYFKCVPVDRLIFSGVHNLYLHRLITEHMFSFPTFRSGR